MISELREKATLRLWKKLALIPSAEQHSRLEMLLRPTDCSLLSLLESLKKGHMTISGPAFKETIERWKTLNDFGLHADNLSTLPAVRLKNLARYAGMTSVFNIARMSPQKRMAVLVAFVLAWETLELDDALDVLDVLDAILAIIIRYARTIGQKKRFRLLKDLEKSALALASACSYLLKEEPRTNRFVLKYSATSPGKSWLESSRLSVKLPGPQTIIFMTKWWSSTDAFVVSCHIC